MNLTDHDVLNRYCPLCGSSNLNEFSHNKVVDGEWHEHLVTQCKDCGAEAPTDTWKKRPIIRELITAGEALDWLLEHYPDVPWIMAQHDCPSYLKDYFKERFHFAHADLSWKGKLKP